MGKILERPQTCLNIKEFLRHFWRKSLWISYPLLCLLVVQIPLDLLRALPMGGSEQTTQTNLEFRLDAIDLLAEILNRVILLGPQLFLVSLHDICKGLLLRHRGVPRG